MWQVSSCLFKTLLEMNEKKVGLLGWDLGEEWWVGCLTVQVGDQCLQSLSFHQSPSALFIVPRKSRRRCSCRFCCRSLSAVNLCPMCFECQRERTRLNSVKYSAIFSSFWSAWVHSSVSLRIVLRPRRKKVFPSGVAALRILGCKVSSAKDVRFFIQCDDTGEFHCHSHCQPFREWMSSKRHSLTVSQNPSKFTSRHMHLNDCTVHSKTKDC